MENTTTNAIVEQPQRIVPPSNLQDDILAPSALISLAVAVTGLIAWVFRVQNKITNRDRDLDEVVRANAATKVQLDALEVRMQAQEAQARVHGELMTRQDRLLEKIEEKLDRLYELLTQSGGGNINRFQSRSDRYDGR